MSNHIPLFNMGVITYSCNNPNAGIANVTCGHDTGWLWYNEQRRAWKKMFQDSTKRETVQISEIEVVMYTTVCTNSFNQLKI